MTPTDSAEANVVFPDVAAWRASSEDDAAYNAAMERAARLLAASSRSETDLRGRLAGAGYPADVVERVLGRLGELGLVNDFAFAREWIDRRMRARRLSPRALLAELEAKGVAPETAEAALAESGLDEDAAAREWAARLSGKVSSRPLGEQAGRLRDMLVRRGFSPEAAEGAVRWVLPPDGWD
jgi:regulatory protein